jgi:enoyl-CoA hydratase/carnithine racemase
MAELSVVVDELTEDPPSVLGLRGAGEKAFVSGGDLNELASIRGVEEASEMAWQMRIVLDRIAALPSIVIAELNGYALGGGAELAISADFRLAADDIRIGFSQITLGITPAWGGIERLVTLIGRSRATYLISTGQLISSAEAALWGLVEEVVPRVSFEERSAELRERIASHPIGALRCMKAIACQVQPSIHEPTAAEAVQRFADTWVSDEHWAAVSAHSGK